MFIMYLACYTDFLGGSLIENLVPMQETWGQSLGQEDPQEKEMATHSSILAWEIPWMGEPVGQQAVGTQKSWTQLSN